MRKEGTTSFGALLLALLASQHHNVHMALLTIGLGGSGMTFMQVYPGIRRGMLLLSVALVAVNLRSVQRRIVDLRDARSHRRVQCAYGWGDRLVLDPFWSLKPTEPTRPRPRSKSSGAGGPEPSVPNTRDPHPVDRPTQPQAPKSCNASLTLATASTSPPHLACRNPDTAAPGHDVFNQFDPLWEPQGAFG